MLCMRYQLDFFFFSNCDLEKTLVARTHVRSVRYAHYKLLVRFLSRVAILDAGPFGALGPPRVEIVYFCEVFIIFFFFWESRLYYRHAFIQTCYIFLKGLRRSFSMS